MENQPYPVAANYHAIIIATSKVNHRFMAMI